VYFNYCTFHVESFRPVEICDAVSSINGPHTFVATNFARSQIPELPSGLPAPDREGLLDD
jgi:hypothetical protein